MSGIIAFYSRAGENYVNGELKTLTVGNTEAAANALQRMINADLFKIEPYIPYSQDYSECLNQTKIDQLRKARPKLVCCPQNIERYDILYLGFPNYWGTMPMPVFSFLEQCRFFGKVIRVFCTHEGDGFGHSMEDIKRIYPDAAIEAGPAIRGASISQAQAEMKNWIQNIGLSENEKFERKW